MISAHSRNPAFNYDVSESDLRTTEQPDPLLTPRAWWRPNPERTRGFGLAESLAVVKDVLQTKTFDVRVSCLPFETLN
jgi:hypothetical protein